MGQTIDVDLLFNSFDGYIFKLGHDGSSDVIHQDTDLEGSQLFPNPLEEPFFLRVGEISYDCFGLDVWV